VSGREGARALVARLEREGNALAEVLVKRGRTRRCELGPGGPVSVLTEEAGWAVRAGGGDGSFFACGSGAPPLDAARPRASGPALRLPDAQPVPAWAPSPALEAPLAVEGEARGLILGLARELGRQLAGARVLHAVLDDGASETVLVSSRGIDCGFASRLASLRVEAVVDGQPETRSTVEVVARGAHLLRPQALVRRLADVLAVRSAGSSPVRERGEMVLAPAVGARLLAALVPLWLGPEAAVLAAALSDRHDRLGSSELSLVDDGRLAGGALESPVDGEGVPTRRLVLVEEGRYLQPLVDWRQAAQGTWKPVGCVRRAGWREVPEPGISHLHVVPDPEVAPADLVSSVARGFYLLDAVGTPRVDPGADRFALEVCGFGLVQGRARSPLARGWLCGGIGALLRGVRAVGRDLTFLPAGGMVGAPTLLLTGLEIRRAL